MGEFDKTKKAIGVGNMDDRSRADMFKKFSDAGGKIVKDKTTEQQSSAKSSPQQGIKTQSGKPTPGGGSSSRSRDRENTKNESKPSGKDLQRQIEEELGSFLNRFLIKIKCWMARVTSFGSPELLPGFLYELNVNGKKALMEFNMVANDFFGNPATASKITKELDQVTPLFIELIGRGHTLYDSTELAQLLEPHNSAPDLPVSIARIKEPLYSIFKKLYYLYPYQSTYRKAVNAAYDALQKIEGKPSIIYSTKKKKISSEIDTLFGPIFEKLYLAIIRNENKNIPLVSIFMERLLEINEEEKVGSRHIGEQLSEISGGVAIDSQENPNDEAPKEENKEEAQSKSKEYDYGMRLMRQFTIDQLRKKHDPRGEIDLPDSDKCMLTYLFFREFDYEYSFVLTTKKILLNPSMVAGVKVEHKQKLLDLYELTRPCMEQFKIYSDVYREFLKQKANPGSNYIEASKKLSGLEQKRSQQSRSSRSMIKEFIEKTRDSLSLIINDMKGKKEIVGNMDEVIKFDALEAKKKMNNKQIKFSMMEAYCYSLAFADRITEGDLFGGVVEMSPEEMEKSFGIPVQQENQSPTNEMDTIIDQSVSNQDTKISDDTMEM